MFIPASALAAETLAGRIDTDYNSEMPALIALSAAVLACISSVHDGDTVRACSGERVRILNIDAPEMPGSPKCEDRRRQGWCDYALAERSRDALAAFLRAGPVVIQRTATDKYGRTLARLSVNGVDAGDYLVAQGLARPWHLSR